VILAIDVHYQQGDDRGGAVAAGVCFNDWTQPVADAVYTTYLHTVAAYESGQFYKRELPCILELLSVHTLTPDIIIVDGYVDFGKAEKALGTYLYEALLGSVGIIGVAKNRFLGISPETEVFRGQSNKPLFVTAIGIDADLARQYIITMAGEYRIPDLLKCADSSCREGLKKIYS